MLWRWTCGQSTSETPASSCIAMCCDSDAGCCLTSAANLPSDCINLGQGYMNFPPPNWVKEAAAEALSQTASNHYSHPKGRIRLREAIREYYSPLFHNLGRPLDVDDEILVSSGANEGEP